MGKGIRDYYEPAWEIVPLAIAVGTLVHEIRVYPRLPARIPTHFDFAGHANGWAQKSLGAAILLGLVSVGMYLLFIGVMFITAYQKDVLKKKRDDVPEQFEDAAKSETMWGVFLSKTVMLAMFLAIDLMSTRVALGQATKISNLPLYGGLGLVALIALRMIVRMTRISREADAALSEGVYRL